MKCADNEAVRRYENCEDSPALSVNPGLLSNQTKVPDSPAKFHSGDEKKRDLLSVQTKISEFGGRSAMPATKSGFPSLPTPICQLPSAGP
jgi:hypothetical protein